MKDFIFCRFMLCSFLSFFVLTGSVSANEGSGGNGGQGIYNGTSIQLRDLVQKNNCIWKLYSTIEKNYPTLKKVLNRIGDVDPVFKYQIEKSFNNVSFCFTQKKLIPLNYNNSDDLYDFPNDDFFQVAIYDDNTIFISLPYFNKMDEHNKSYTLLHEISHTFYNLDEQLRSEREPRLRQFIMNIEASVDELSFELLSLLIKQADFRYVDRIKTVVECYINGDQSDSVFYYIKCIKLFGKMNVQFNSSRLTELNDYYKNILIPNYIENLETNGYENIVEVIATVEPFIIGDTDNRGIAAGIFTKLITRNRAAIPYTDSKIKDIYNVFQALNIDMNLWGTYHSLKLMSADQLNSLSHNLNILFTIEFVNQQRCELTADYLYQRDYRILDEYRHLYHDGVFYEKIRESDNIPNLRDYRRFSNQRRNIELSMSSLAPLNDHAFFKSKCLLFHKELKHVLNERHQLVQRSRVISSYDKKNASDRTWLICHKMIGDKKYCKRFY